MEIPHATAREHHIQPTIRLALALLPIVTALTASQVEADASPVSRQSTQSFHGIWRPSSGGIPPEEVNWSSSTDTLLPYGEFFSWTHGGLVGQESEITADGGATLLMVAQGGGQGGGGQPIVGYGSSTSFVYTFQVIDPNTYSIVGNSQWAVQGPSTVTFRLSDSAEATVWQMAGSGAFDVSGSLVAGWYTLTATIDAPPTGGATESWLTARMSIVPAPATIVLLGISGLRTARRRW